VPADVARPPAPRPERPLTPPGKRAACYFMTAVFMAAAVVTLNLTGATPAVKEGETARRDYRARVAFGLPDAEGTRQSREEAQARALRVFRESAGHLADLKAQSERLFTDVLDARKPQDLRTKWGLSEEDFQALKEGLDRKWIAVAGEAVAAAARKAAAYGIIEGAARRAELASERYEFLVRGEGPAPEDVRRSTTLTIEYPDGVREFLADEWQPIFVGKAERFRASALAVLTPRFSPTLKPDLPATEESVRAARTRVPERFRSVMKDSLMLSSGERVTAEAARELRAEGAAWAKVRAAARNAEEHRAEMLRAALAAAGITAVFVVAFVLLVFGAARIAPEIFESNNRISAVYVVCLASLVTVRLLENFGASLQWAPVPLAAMFLTVMAGQGMALAVTAFLCLLIAMMSAQGAAAALPLALSAALAALLCARLRRRTHAFEAGILAGAVQFVAVAALWAWQFGTEGASPRWPMEDALAALGGGALAGAIVSAALPYVERMFDVATDMRLLEWTDQNQPLLRRLALDAPGTYHHSAVVSSLAEVAAKEIGANALLACAGGYLHDVGKIARAEYFIENLQGRPSPHDALSPNLSALILTAHTKDGVEVAAHYGVPAPIRRIIGEHHGTFVAQYFFSKARNAAAPGQEVAESTFRYRGPKPHSRESAIVMLADAAESAARALDTASPAAVERLVREIVEARLEDGQLDESQMNITDVRKVERSLVRSLTAVSHSRIRYPAHPREARP
jgi:putative nucleotidyltransferase with HDIG domain